MNKFLELSAEIDTSRTHLTRQIRAKHEQSSSSKSSADKWFSMMENSEDIIKIGIDTLNGSIVQKYRELYDVPQMEEHDVLYPIFSGRSPEKELRHHVRMMGTSVLTSRIKTNINAGGSSGYVLIQMPMGRPRRGQHHFDFLSYINFKARQAGIYRDAAQTTYLPETDPDYNWITKTIQHYIDVMKPMMNNVDRMNHIQHWKANEVWSLPGSPVYMLKEANPTRYASDFGSSIIFHKNRGRGNSGGHQPTLDQIKRQFPWMYGDKSDDDLKKEFDEMSSIAKLVYTSLNMSLDMAQASPFLQISVPKEVIEYGCDSPFDNVSRQHFAHFARAMAKGMFSKTGSKVVVGDINTLMPTINNLTQFKPNSPDMLTGNLYATSNRFILYIPNYQNESFYDMGLDDTGLTVSNEEMEAQDSLVVERVKPSQRPKSNQIVYTDWAHSNLIYTDGHGAIKTLSFAGAKPVSTDNVVKLLSLDINEVRDILFYSYAAFNDLEDHPDSKIDVQASWDYVDMLVQWSKTNSGGWGWLETDLLNISKWITKLGDNGSKVLKDSNSVSNFLQLVASTNYAFSKREGFEDENPDIAKRIVVRDKYSLYMLENDLLTKPLFDALINACKIIASKYQTAQSINDMLSDVKTKLAAIGLAKALARPFNVKDMMADWDKALKARKEKGNIVSPHIPYAPKNLKFMPHQARIHDELHGKDQDHKFVVFDVSAGGGKSLMFITDVLTLLQKRKIKRPLFLMPNSLIKQCINELHTFTGGKVNCIPVNNEVLDFYKKQGVSEPADVIQKMFENAPPNTIVLADMKKFLSSKKVSIPYFGTQIDVSQNLTAMCSYQPDYVIMDESHNLRNPQSGFSQAVSELIQGCKYVRLATGTIIFNTPTDLVGQIGLMDPMVFGDADTFRKTFAKTSSGTKVLDWGGSESAAMEEAALNVKIVKARRYEWDALLPERKDEFVKVVPSADQMKVYDAIIAQITDEDMEQTLKGLEEDDDVENEERLKYALARVDRFWTSPDKDELGKDTLKGLDRVGPKVRAVYELIRRHLKSGDKGKVLVFTSYILSAESIMDNVPDDLDGKIMLFKAADKEKAQARFERDTKLVAMVGVEEAMREGLNLQFVSRLIRTETVWTPGAQEQGDARLYRPDPKNEYGERKTIHISWLVTDGSVDVLKTSYLIWKTIVARKAENWENVDYARIPNLDASDLRLSKRSIQKKRSFSEMNEYLGAYEQLRGTQRKEVEDYAKQFPERSKMVDTFDSGGIDDEAYMLRTPYVKGQILPFNHEKRYGVDLGLVPMIEYSAEMGFDDVSEFDATGLMVNTEFGDGKVLRSTGTTVRVVLDESKLLGIKNEEGGKSKADPAVERYVIDKNYIDVPKAKTLVYRPGTYGKTASIRLKMMELTGLPKVVTPSGRVYDVDSLKLVKLHGKVGITKLEPVETPKTDTDAGGGNKRPGRPRKEVAPVETPPEDNAESIEPMSMWVSSWNNTPALVIDDEHEMSEVFHSKEKFIEYPTCIRVHITQLGAFKAVIKRIKENFEVEPEYIDALMDAMDKFVNGTGAKATLNVLKMARSDLRHFLLQTHKKVPNGVIRPFPTLVNEQFYLFFELKNQPAARKLPTLLAGIPKIHIEKDEGFAVRLFASKEEIMPWIAKVIKKYGIEVDNMDEVKHSLKVLKFYTKGKTVTR
jgi:hypothetical protein